MRVYVFYCGVSQDASGDANGNTKGTTNKQTLSKLLLVKIYGPPHVREFVCCGDSHEHKKRLFCNTKGKARESNKNKKMIQIIVKISIYYRIMFFAHHSVLAHKQSPHTQK